MHAIRARRDIVVTTGRAQPRSSPVLKQLSGIAPKAVEWLWPGRIPLGKLTVLDGDPGLGKSVVTMDISARVSTGRPMPDGTASDLNGPAGVLLLSAEDDAEDTVVPRLLAASADMTMVAMLEDSTMGPSRGFTLDDLDRLETAIDQTRAKLIVIDPLVAYLPGWAKVNSDQDMRQVLSPISGLADRMKVAFVLVRHLNKKLSANPLYRGGGSIGIAAAARSVMLVAKDPEDEREQRRVLAVSKVNVAEPPVSLAYHLEPDSQGGLRVIWDGPVDYTAHTLLSEILAQEDPSALSTAISFLEEMLGDGKRVPSVPLYEEAKRREIKKRTLDRAKARLGVVSKRVDLGTNYYWELYIPQEPVSQGGVEVPQRE